MSNRRYSAMGTTKFQNVVDNFYELDAEDQAKVRVLAGERGIVIPDGPVANAAPLIPSGRTKPTGLTADLAPMLCGRSFQEVPTLAPTSWSAERKLDGWRCIAYSDGEFVRIFGGRNGSDYTGQVPYIEAELANFLPPDTVVDGELISPCDWGAVQSIMTTHRIHKPSTHSPALNLVLFDLLRINGTDARRNPWKERRATLEALEGIPRLKQWVSLSALVEPSQEALEATLEAGYEGLVLKNKSSRYVNARSPMWGKVKPMKTLDCRVVALPKDGEGKFAGLVGAVEFQLPNGGVGRASGMTDRERIDMTDNPEKYIGQMAEFSYQLMTKDGRLRHPVFKRMRGDLK